MPAPTTSDPNPPGDRLVIVTSSPRLPAGLLSWQGWQALRSGPVRTGDPDCPQARAVRAAGIEVHGIDAASPSPRDRAYALRELARGGRTAVWLAGPDGDARFGQALGDLVAREGGTAELEVVYGSWDPPGARLLDVVATMDRLRAPGGCPWDREQTHESLMPYLLEETYEAYQALEDGDRTALREELGDVLFQVAFHSRIAEEAGPEEGWTIDDVAGDLVAKLVRRHPHVFAGQAVSGADEVLANWDRLKRAEREGRPMTEGVPLALPALTLAATLQRKAARAGVPPDLLPADGTAPDGTAPDGSAADGSAADGSAPDGSAPSAAVGRRLFALVARARAAGVDPEAALRAVARAVRDDLTEAERRARADGRDPYELDAEAWRAYWPR